MRALLVVAAIVSLAGCEQAGPSAFPAVGPEKRELAMTGLGGTVLDGRCPDGATELGDSCHVIRLLIDNTGSPVTVDLHPGMWEATLQDGRIVDFGQATPGTVPAGKAQEVRVQFTVKADWPDIATVSFDGFQVFASADVPPY